MKIDISKNTIIKRLSLSEIDALVDTVTPDGGGMLFMSDDTTDNSLYYLNDVGDIYNLTSTITTSGTTIITGVEYVSSTQVFFDETSELCCDDPVTTQFYLVSGDSITSTTQLYSDQYGNTSIANGKIYLNSNLYDVVNGVISGNTVVNQSYIDTTCGTLDFSGDTTLECIKGYPTITYTITPPNTCSSNIISYGTVTPDVIGGNPNDYEITYLDNTATIKVLNHTLFDENMEIIHDQNIVLDTYFSLTISTYPNTSIYLPYCKEQITGYTLNYYCNEDQACYDNPITSTVSVIYTVGNNSDGNLSDLVGRQISYTSTSVNINPIIDHPDFSSCGTEMYIRLSSGSVNEYLVVNSTGTVTAHYTQAGLGCTASMFTAQSQNPGIYPQAGGSSSLSFQASANGWEAEIIDTGDGVSWVNITSPTTGTGGGVINYTVSTWPVPQQPSRSAQLRVTNTSYGNNEDYITWTITQYPLN